MADTYYPEYDPTPYGGGFDLEEAYGKSNAPSEKSCYAPSISPADPDLSSLRDHDDDNLSAYGVEMPHFHSDASTQPEPRPQPEGNDKGNYQDNDHLQVAPNNDGRWTPNYPEPDTLLRDSDLLLPLPRCTCGMPNYCACAYNIFQFYNQDDEQKQQQSSQHESTAPQDVANKVAQWLFSSTYI